MLDWYTKFRVFLAGIDPLIVLSFVFLIGLYIFWRGSLESRKNRSSVFDMFLISGLLSTIVGRVYYIIIEWSSFSSFIWYWLPYEKYGEKIYLFRLLPWRFLSIWDGGLVILSMFVSILLFMTFYSLVIKKWKWKHMFFPIYFSATTMLGLSFVMTGVVGDFNEWIVKGGILLLFLVVFFVIFKFLYKVIKDPLKEKYMIGYVGLLIVWVSSVYITYIYLNDDLSIYEDIATFLFAVWSVVMGIFFLMDLRRPNVRIETRSTIRSVTVS